MSAEDLPFSFYYRKARLQMGETYIKNKDLQSQQEECRKILAESTFIPMFSFSPECSILNAPL